MVQYIYYQIITLNVTKYFITLNVTKFLITLNVTKYLISLNVTKYLITLNVTKYLITLNVTKYLITLNVTKFLSTLNVIKYLTQNHFFITCLTNVLSNITNLIINHFPTFSFFQKKVRNNLRRRLISRTQRLNFNPSVNCSVALAVP